MAGLGDTVVVSDQGGSTDEDVAYTYLTSAVSLAMISGVALHNHGCKLCLAVHVDVFVGDEYVVKDHQQLHAAVLGIAHIALAALQIPGVTALAEQTLGVGRSGEGNSVILILGFHGLGGYYQDLV